MPVVLIIITVVTIVRLDCNSGEGFADKSNNSTALAGIIDCSEFSAHRSLAPTTGLIDCSGSSAQSYNRHNRL